MALIRFSSCVSPGLGYGLLGGNFGSDYSAHTTTQPNKS